MPEKTRQPEFEVAGSAAFIIMKDTAHPQLNFSFSFSAGSLSIRGASSHLNNLT